MSISEAWGSGRPIFYRLPGKNGAYSENPIADWLSYFWDELLIQTKAKIDDIEARQLDPVTCDAEWLDFLAPLMGWDSKYWNPRWSDSSKRTLLSNTWDWQKIWETKGTLNTLSFVLTAIGIRNQVVVDGDFIIGTNEVGDPIGYDPWSYTIYLPPEYERQNEYRETLKIDSLFGPAWCERTIVFDEERFRVIDLLATEDGLAIATEDGTDEIIGIEDD